MNNLHLDAKWNCHLYMNCCPNCGRPLIKLYRRKVDGAYVYCCSSLECKGEYDEVGRFLQESHNKEDELNTDFMLFTKRSKRLFK